VLGGRLEVVEGLTRSINALFIEVHNFSRIQLRILRTVRAEACVSLRIMHTVHALPLVNLCTLIFDPSIYFFAF
jgi:hypothetical protein